MKLTFYDKLIVFSSKDLYSNIKFHKTKNKKKINIFLGNRLLFNCSFIYDNGILFDNKLKCTLLMYKIY